MEYKLSCPLVFTNQGLSGCIVCLDAIELFVIRKLKMEAYFIWEIISFTAMIFDPLHLHQTLFNKAEIKQPFNDSSIHLRKSCTQYHCYMFIYKELFDNSNYVCRSMNFMKIQLYIYIYGEVVAKTTWIRCQNLRWLKVKVIIIYIPYIRRFCVNRYVWVYAAILILLNLLTILE